MTVRETGLPRTAAWLGGLGLIPFVTGAAGVWLLAVPHHDTAVFLLRTYAAVILSFMGAIHWGLAMASHDGSPGTGMVASVFPALLAWAALALPPAGTLALMAPGFLGVYWLDERAIGAGRAPAWYRRLRRPLTAVVLLCLAIAITGLLGRGLP